MIFAGVRFVNNQLEVNAQCLTIEESNSGCFAKFLAYPIIFLEAVIAFW